MRVLYCSPHAPCDERSCTQQPSRRCSLSYSAMYDGRKFVASVICNDDTYARFLIHLFLVCALILTTPSLPRCIDCSRSSCRHPIDNQIPSERVAALTAGHMRSRDGQVDNKAADPPANTEPQNAPVDTTLPPRVVVELPDGEVQIGEDSQRLQHEQVQLAGTANRNGSTHRAGAQPGTEQWLELRRLLYATALEAISIKRKRISTLLVGKGSLPCSPCTDYSWKLANTLLTFL